MGRHAPVARGVFVCSLLEIETDTGFQVTVADSRQMTALMAGMDLALCIANRLRAYIVYFQRLPPGLTTDNLRDALVVLYTYLLSFLAKALRAYSANKASRMFEALWRASDIVDFEDDCDKLGERADIEANNCDRELRAEEQLESAVWKAELDKTLQTLAGIQSMKQTLDNIDMKVDLSRLRSIGSAVYNSAEEGLLAKCLDGTRTELLARIASWADDPDSKRILWLCGKAGTGKSTISRTVADRLYRQERLGGSFFFKRGEADRSSARSFFPTIVAQLVDQIPAMRRSVAGALDRDSLLCDRSLPEQFERLLLRPLGDISADQIPTDRLVIVIDALDECDNHMDIRSFLNLLSQLESDNIVRIQVFVTSRPDLRSQVGFRNFGAYAYDDVLLEIVQEPTIAHDIRLFFDYHLRRIRDEYNQQDPYEYLPPLWPGEGNIQKLVDLACPLFISAFTVCRYMVSTSPERGLQAVLERRSAVTSALGQTYLPVLEQLFHKQALQNHDNILRDFRVVVGAVVVLAEPLSAATLHLLLQVSLEDIHNVLKHLHPVLSIPKDKHRPIRLFHLSFRDYLTTESKANPFWIDDSATHHEIALRCIDRLSQPDVLHPDICCVTKPGTRRLDIDKLLIDQHISTDVGYACTYWAWHLSKSRRPLLDDCEAHRFLQEHFLHWLEALSWLGRLSQAATHVRDLLSLTKVCCK